MTINDPSNSTGQREICTKREKKYHSIEEAVEATTQGMIKTLSNKFNIEYESGNRHDGISEV